MVFGMATAKLTITLPDEQLNAIRELVTARKAASISGFVQHAVGIALSDAAGWRMMLDDALQQTGGPLTDEEKAWADSILDSPKRKSVEKRAPGGSSRRNKAA